MTIVTNAIFLDLGQPETNLNSTARRRFNRTKEV
jgi:hypothetical protein